MEDFIKVYTASGNIQLQLINRASDPAMWVLNIYKKILFFKRKITSYWFTGREEAEKFAEEYVIKNT